MKNKNVVVAILFIILTLSNIVIPFSNVFAAENEILNKSDLKKIEIHEMTEEEFNQLECNEISNESNTISPMNLYAFSRNSYASTYAYDQLNSENKKDAYKNMQYGAYLFHNSNDDVKEVNGYYPAMKIDVKNCNLSIEEIEKVYFSFYYDNPEYYWLDTISYYYSLNTGKVSTVVLNVSEEYAQSSVRNALTETIERNIENYLNFVTLMSTDFEKELIIHEALIYYCDYAYKSNGSPEDSAFAHNIVGVFDDDPNTNPVCEGYAKAFLLLMSATGIDCGFVGGFTSGGAHAWNQVKLDNEWYNIDVTWDDPGGKNISYSYFNITDEKLKKDHTPFSTNSTYNWCYDTYSATATKYSYENQEENMPNIELAKTVTYESTDELPLCIFNKGVEVPSGAKVLPDTKLDISILSKDTNIAEYYMLEINGERIPLEKIADANEEYVEYGTSYTAISSNMEFRLVEKSDEDFELVLNKDNITFNEKGNTDNLEVTFKGKTIDNSTLKFTSNNPYVARINGSGTVTSVSKGIATIKVVSEDLGKEITCNVLGDMEYLLGDVDNNEEVDITDAYTLLRFVLSRMDEDSIHASVLPAANFSNDDEEIDITDAYLLVRYIINNM